MNNATPPPSKEPNPTLEIRKTAGWNRITIKTQPEYVRFIVSAVPAASYSSSIKNNITTHQVNCTPEQQNFKISFYSNLYITTYFILSSGHYQVDDLQSHTANCEVQATPSHLVHIIPINEILKGKR